MSDGRFFAGQKAWNKKPWIEKVCPTCGAAFSVKPSLDRVKTCSARCGQLGKMSPMKGRTTPPEVRAKQRAAKLGIRGPAHWNWRGGLRSERKTVMSRDEYKCWRAAVFARDNFTCQLCGVRGVTIHADHIKPWATHPELRLDVSNGRTLCVPCHHTTPSFPKKLIPKEMRI